MKYAASVALTVAGLAVSILGGYLAAMALLSGEGLPPERIALYGGMAAGGILLMTWMREVRVEARQEAETDQYGNKKKGYKYLSAQERKMMDLQTMAENERALSDSEFRGMVKAGSKDPDKDLEGLTGLASVKEKVLELKAQMMYMDRKERKGMHMCFLGNPGTGKTTVAGIITGFFHKYKFIRKNEYVLIDGNSLNSTPDPIRRTNLLLQRCHGKVLFIDEAYALAYDRSGTGSEILATLLNTMENSRDDMFVILAGYRKEMRMLFDMNSGLRSRIREYIFFEDYDIGEMEAIFDALLRKGGYGIEPEARDLVLRSFLWGLCSPSFANARTVRNIYESAVNRHMLNRMQKVADKEHEMVLIPEDVLLKDEERSYFE